MFFRFFPNGENVVNIGFRAHPPGRECPRMPPNAPECPRMPSENATECPPNALPSAGVPDVLLPLDAPDDMTCVAIKAGDMT